MLSAKGGSRKSFWQWEFVWNEEWGSYLTTQIHCMWRQRQSRDWVSGAPDLEDGVWGNEHYILLEKH